VRAAGQVSDCPLCRTLQASQSCIAEREGKDFVYVGKVGTGFNRKSSMEIRKKLDAIVSSKSRLVKAPRLKGASWVLRADR
jgi:ATP-dependent DNA ligase